MRYLIFNAEKDQYGDQSSLKGHLYYLNRWGGTPDCWDSEDDLADALDNARHAPFKSCVVDGYRYEVIWAENGG